jgi:predicted RNase H-like nuclease (RuvC/YqgF family)
LSTNEPRTLEQTWGLLEEKLEGLTTRYRDLSSENARLKGAVVELSAERDRLKREIADARELLGKSARHEAEREEVRGRIERLLKSLEAAEGATVDA